MTRGSQVGRSSTRPTKPVGLFDRLVDSLESFLLGPSSANRVKTARQNTRPHSRRPPSRRASRSTSYPRRPPHSDFLRPGASSTSAYPFVPSRARAHQRPYPMADQGRGPLPIPPSWSFPSRSPSPAPPPWSAPPPVRQPWHIPPPPQHPSPQRHQGYDQSHRGYYDANGFYIPGQWQHSYYDDGLPGIQEEFYNAQWYDQAAQSRPPPQPVAKVECSTCVTDFDSRILPPAPESCRNQHPPTTCRHCWEQWLDSQVSQMRVDQIACLQCGTRLAQHDVKALALPSTFEKYLDAELKTALSTDDAFIWCLSRTCKSGQIHNGGNIFTCSSCGFEQCIECKTLWHRGRTCAQAQGKEDDDGENIAEKKKRLAKEEAASGQTLRESKICPGKRCGRRVQKMSGCDHMTCTMCRHEFCWLCLASYKDIRSRGNSAHMAHCRYHA